jgi:hypothetical protein
LRTESSVDEWKTEPEQERHTSKRLARQDERTGTGIVREGYQENPYSIL